MLADPFLIHKTGERSRQISRVDAPGWLDAGWSEEPLENAETGDSPMLPSETNGEPEPPVNEPIAEEIALNADEAEPEPEPTPKTSRNAGKK